MDEHTRTRAVYVCKSRYRLEQQAEYDGDWSPLAGTVSAKEAVRFMLEVNPPRPRRHPDEQAPRYQEAMRDAGRGTLLS